MIDHIPKIPGYYYLGSPYSKYPEGLEAAFQEVSKAAGLLIKAGHKVYSPIAHTHPVAIHSGLDPLDHSIWLPADEPFMHGAGGLVVLKMTSWRVSYGLSVEIETFNKLRKPVEYMEWNDGP